jgi:hypothetical protein
VDATGGSFQLLGAQNIPANAEEKHLGNIIHGAMQRSGALIETTSIMITMVAGE